MTTYSRRCVRLYACIRARGDIQHASSQQREEPSREIILTRSHIRASADGYESIKISHREPRVRRGNISNIRRRWDPSPVTPPTLDHHPSWSLHHTSPFLVSHRSPLSPYRLFALLLSRCEKHFLSTAPARVSRTRVVNFSSLLPYKRLSVFRLLSPPPPLSQPLYSLFPSLAYTFYVVFPDMSRGHEYVNPGLGSWKVRDTGGRFYSSIEVGNVSMRNEWRNWLNLKEADEISLEQLYLRKWDLNEIRSFKN